MTTNETVTLGAIVTVGGYTFQHVHDCFPAQEAKGRCTYDWDDHVTTGDGSQCPCIPHIDDRNVKLGKGKDVFVVHKGND